MMPALEDKKGNKYKNDIIYESDCENNDEFHKEQATEDKSDTEETENDDKDQLHPLPSLDKSYDDNDIYESGRADQDDVIRPEKTSSRKRSKDVDGWRRNIIKNNREAGKAYFSSHNQTFRRARRSNGKCQSDKCHLHCEIAITVQERQNIFKRFWTLTDEEKNHFYSQFVKVSPAKRKRTENAVSRRFQSFTYFFETDNKSTQVCRQFFLSTLDIDKQRIYYLFKNKIDRQGVAQTPQKGKHVKNFIAKEHIDGVKAHINSFPVMDCHYCQTSSTKKYLECYLNIKIMYEMYKESEYIHNNYVVKEHKYREIFNTYFNLNFVKPRKDKCHICEVWLKKRKAAM